MVKYSLIVLNITCKVVLILPEPLRAYNGLLDICGPKKVVLPLLVSKYFVRHLWTKESCFTVACLLSTLLDICGPKKVVLPLLVY